MVGCANMLVDDNSDFLRGVNEVSRTLFLRASKVSAVVKALETMDAREVAPRLQSRIKQLLDITAAQQQDDKPGSAAAESLKVFRECEACIYRLEEVQCSQPQQSEDRSKQDNASEEQPSDENTTAYHELNRATELLDGIADEVLDDKIVAEMELKVLESSMLEQWKSKKIVYEKAWTRYLALTGMRHALKVAADRHLSCRPAYFSGTLADSMATTEAYEEDELRSNDTEELSEASHDHKGDSSSSALSLHVLSDYLPEGNTDPKEREDILKSNHPGSRDHPHACRPCHFQGDLCWKGLNCSFCHLCPKPKRKSKHQRDVDKRRQERYRQVKDHLGVQCLDELTKIDDSRRQIMASTEELKKQVKDAYATRLDSEIGAIRHIVAEVQANSDAFRILVPQPLREDGEGEETCEGFRVSGICEQAPCIAEISSSTSGEQQAVRTDRIADAGNEDSSSGVSGYATCFDVWRGEGQGPWHNIGEGNVDGVARGCGNGIERQRRGPPIQRGGAAITALDSSYNSREDSSWQHPQPWGERGLPQNLAQYWGQDPRQPLALAGPMGHGAYAGAAPMAGV
eukprot:CAMPEP_0117462030 /NCGR_PEP_ID=MMETSP0784-20121206/2840_1 /TAXON_ID=39447 /ORGANISM="" /LENGTH=571 /DNA_ID=CAMNT_0005255775 /DNA_START=144 /DNA_END=1856 /DNA_ORIENTATION=-